MDFPILDRDTRIGTLTISRDGLYTRFEAAIAAREGLQRLWLCGERDAACLGVLTPEDGRLTLRRRLSRAALRGFPAPLLYAALQEPVFEPPAPPPERDGFRRVQLFGEGFVLFQAGS